jgi:thioesterase domain-containing protein
VPDTIDEMAADRLAVIRRIQTRGPYLLGGFCNGALIAYEMARQLEQAGERVEGVVLIGADASNFKFRLLEGVARGVGRLLGENRVSQSARFRNWRNWTLAQQERVREQIKRVRKLAEEPISLQRSSGVLSSGACTARTASPSPDAIGVGEATPTVMDAYMAALDAYVPRPFGGRVILVSAKDDPLTAGQSPTYGWEALCGDLELIEVPGEHQSSVALEQNMRILAARLREVLDSPSQSERISRSS